MVALPFELHCTNFSLVEIIGYPHTGNGVFHVKGIYQEEVEAYIKVARQLGADIENEINIINRLNCNLTPTIIDYDTQKNYFVVSVAKQGERLSTIVGDNSPRVSLEYLYEYGQTLAKLHQQEGKFEEVKDRRFFHTPTAATPSRASSSTARTARSTAAASSPPPSPPLTRSPLSPPCPSRAWPTTLLRPISSEMRSTSATARASPQALPLS